MSFGCEMVKDLLTITVTLFIADDARHFFKTRPPIMPLAPVIITFFMNVKVNYSWDIFMI